MNNDIVEKTITYRQDLKKKTTIIVTGNGLEEINMAKKRKGEKFSSEIGLIVALLKTFMIKENIIDSIVELLRKDLK